MIEARCPQCKKRWTLEEKNQLTACPDGHGPLEYAVLGTVADDGEPGLSGDDVAKLHELGDKVKQVRQEIARAIVGQHEILIQLLAALFAGGHCLLEGVPGLAKTLIVRSLAKTLGLTFKRIQFTPDLMPSDITGTQVYEQDPTTGKLATRFEKGPIFAHLILADEINRTPPKTQAALLEAMAEEQVTVGTETRRLQRPFLVMATQNPIEQEGTYPLPEAQQDRFLFKLKLHYPAGRDELLIMKRVSSGAVADLRPVLRDREIVQYQRLVHHMPVADNVFRWALRLARATRPGQPEAAPEAEQWIQYGAGPRASINLILAAKSLAAISGRDFVTRQDVAKMAKPVLRHRLIPSFRAMNEDLDSDTIIGRLLARLAQGRATRAKGA